MDHHGGTGQVRHTGPFKLPDIVPIDYRSLLELARWLNKSFGAFNDKTKNATKDLIKHFDMLTRDGGFLDGMNEAIDTFTSRLAEKVKRLTFRIVNGSVTKRDDDADLRANLAGLVKQYDMLRNQRNVINVSLREVTQRIKSLQGQHGSLGKEEQKELENLIAERRNLTKRRIEARGKVADAIEARFQAQQALVPATVERANDVAQNATGRLDASVALLDALGRVAAPVLRGGRVAFTGARLAAFEEKGNVLTAQRDQLGQALLTARSFGDEKTVRDLGLQIKQLNASIKQNVQAYLQARVDATNAAASYRTGTADLRIQLIDLDGQLRGTTNVQARVAQLNEKSNALAEQRNRLLALYNEAVAKNNTAAIHDLTDQLLQNQIASKENTIAIRETTGQQDQQWSSTAWQWFRNAVFTGSGGLLPRFRPPGIPGMDTGGRIVSSGLIFGHQDETIMRPATVARGAAGAGGDTLDLDLHVTEQVQRLDPDAIAAKMMFRWRTRR